MNGLTTIGIIASVAVLAIIAVDLHLLTQGRPTLSHWMLVEGRKDPVIAAVFGLAVGILIGHFWWPNS